MKTAVVTDGRYRNAIVIARALHRAGYRVVVTQTRKECSHEPPVFFSNCVDEALWLDGSCYDAAYFKRLKGVLEQYNHPVLLCVGAVTLNMVSEHASELAQCCRFLIADKPVLDRLNDKAQVYEQAKRLGIPVPKQHTGVPTHFPVVIKPHCGEKLNLKAQDRYQIAHDRREYEQVMRNMRQYDENPIVQEKISGDGMGVNVLMDQDSRLIVGFCHRRIREYPTSGGPSTCCVSCYDETKLKQAYRLLQSVGFRGLAMVEFKGDCILEVNPRIWGSFALTECAGSRMTEKYAATAEGILLPYSPCDYRTGVRMRFVLNDTLAMLTYFRSKNWKKGVSGVVDIFRASEALFDPKDCRPFWEYLIGYLK